jgi:perosamine synthetase
MKHRDVKSRLQGDQMQENSQWAAASNVEPTNTPIPVARPDLTGDEEKYVVDAIRSSWISSTGAYITRFEKEFAELCGTRTSISVCNGTVALHLALLTLDVRRGDEVIVPSLTYIATANVVRYMGAVPVFVDVDPDTWCIDPKKIEAAVTPRTKGIIVVHLYGHPADMDEINHIAAVNGLWVVEDAAEAPLATYKGRPVGSLAPIATFSFYGNKIFTCGEGGAVTLSDTSHEVRARTLRGQGMDPKRQYYFPITGYNFRLTNVACAMLCAQLERRDQILRRRYDIYTLYRKLLGDIPGIGLQPNASWAVVAPWLFSITIATKVFGRSRDEVIAGLAKDGIDTRPFFIPLHTLPPFRDEARRRAEHLPRTEDLGQSGINLPTYNAMTNADVERVVGVIKSLAR